MSQFRTISGAVPVRYPALPAKLEVDSSTVQPNKKAGSRHPAVRSGWVKGQFFQDAEKRHRARQKKLHSKQRGAPSTSPTRFPPISETHQNEARRDDAAEAAVDRAGDGQGGEPAAAVVPEEERGGGSAGTTAEAEVQSILSRTGGLNRTGSTDFCRTVEFRLDDEGGANGASPGRAERPRDPNNPFAQTLLLSACLDESSEGIARGLEDFAIADAAAIARELGPPDSNFSWVSSARSEFFNIYNIRRHAHVAEGLQTRAAVMSSGLGSAACSFQKIDMSQNIRVVDVSPPHSSPFSTRFPRPFSPTFFVHLLMEILGPAGHPQERQPAAEDGQAGQAASAQTMER